MYTKNKDETMTFAEVEKYIEDFKFRYLPKLTKNKRYYECRNDAITNRVFTDKTKPNNKITTPWSEYIVTLISGYFAGKPVTYDTKNEELKEILSLYTVKEISHNQAIAKDCAIYGIAAELLFIDENKKVRFEKVEPTTIIPIYSTEITKELLYCIRFWDSTNILTNETITHIEVYDSENVMLYQSSTTGTKYLGSKKHYFNDVPVNIFYNNEDMTGDAERVHHLIDGYDLALSDTANFREELNDSYLVFKNTNLEETAIMEMKQNKVIAIEDAEQGMQSSVAWLNKDSNDTENENYKNRLAQDIKAFSCISELESKSHTTATQAKLSMLALEQKCATKETYFRKALLNRWKLICSYFNLLGSTAQADDLKITFLRNIPIDMSVVADSVTKFAPYISKRSLLTQIPFVNDIEAELAAIKEENMIDGYEDILSGDEDEK